MRRTLMNIINNVQIVVYFHLYAIKILPVENKYLQIYYKKFEYFYTCSHRIELFGTESLLFGSRKNVIIALTVLIVFRITATFRSLITRLSLWKAQ